MTTFQQDLQQSQAKEQALEDTLNYMGYYTTNTSQLGQFSGYDVAAWAPGNKAKTVTYEVKYDEMSSTTGNVAVEVCKTIDGERKPSGLTATKATYQAYCFPNDSNFYIIDTWILGNMVKNQEYIRVVDGGDGGRAKLCLFKKEYFISKCSVI